MAAMGAAPRTPRPADDVAITIYSSAAPGGIPAQYYRPQPGQGTPNAMGVPGYAMVRQDRAVTLAAGRSQLRFTDVAALIDPTTVTFTSLTDPATRVLEQNFQFDLLSTTAAAEIHRQAPDRGAQHHRRRHDQCQWHIAVIGGRPGIAWR